MKVHVCVALETLYKINTNSIVLEYAELYRNWLFPIFCIGLKLVIQQKFSNSN